MSPKTRFLPLIKKMGMFPVLLLIVLLFSVINENFLLINNIENVFIQTAINIVLASGMTVVILTGGIDLSVGSLMAMTAVMAMLASTATPLAPLLAILLGGLIGAIVGILIAYVRLPPFIVTLGGLTSYRGAAFLLANGTTVINNDLGFAWVANEKIFGVSYLIIISLLLVLVFWFVLRKTVFGIWVYSIGGNMEAARLTGIPVRKVLVTVYMISGVCAGLAGVMIASRLYSANGFLGNGAELDAIAAVILGGTSFVGGIGGIGGTLIGALIIGVLDNGLTLMQVSDFWQSVIKGLVIVIAVIVDKLRNKGVA